MCAVMPIAVSWGRLSHIKFNFDLKILIENEYKTNTKWKKEDVCIGKMKEKEIQTQTNWICNTRKKRWKTKREAVTW